MLTEQSEFQWYSGTTEVHVYFLLWYTAPSRYTFQFMCLFFMVFLTLPVVRLPVIKFCCWNFRLALDNLHLPPKVPALSTSAHLSSCIANVLQVWFTDPMILGSPGPSQGLCKVNTIFIVTARHDLLLPICWQKLWKVLHYGNLLTLTL